MKRKSTNSIVLPGIGVLVAFLLLLSASGCKDKSTEPTPPGEKWQIITASAGGLASNDIRSFGSDASGRKWIGTSAGVSELAKGVWTTYTSVNGLSGNTVTAIAPGWDASLWFGTQGNFITRYIENDPQQAWRIYNVSSGLDDGMIYALAFDKHHDAWVGTNGGVYQFVETIGSTNHAGVWNNYTTSVGLPGIQITAVAVDLNDTKWFGTATHGIASFDGSSWQPYPLPQGDQIRTTSIATDASGAKWVGTWAGVLRFDGRNWTVYDTATGLPSNTVNSVAVAGGTIVWIGTDKGAARFDGTSWTKFNRSNSNLISDTVSVVGADINKNIWFGTPLGITLYNEGGIQL